MSKIKILYYNWVDFEDEQQRGGGVSIYQRNLIDAATQYGDEVWFLSSGVCYTPFLRRPFLREVKARKQRVRKFEIVNSTILSPGQEAFGQDVAISPELDPLFADFLREHGPFDVVHFNNLEGIPVSFLRLAREHFPQAKIIYSVHNYFAFCPQVNLWFQERSVCSDFSGGRKCVNCLIKPRHPRSTKRLYRLDYCLRKLGLPSLPPVDRAVKRLIFGLLRSIYHLAREVYRGKTFATKRASKATAILDPVEASSFADRRRIFVEALNTYTDHVLAVSRRVAELTIGFGIDPAKVQTLYIGTRFAEQRTPIAGAVQPLNNDILRIAYLGYMRLDKGFYFYLKALKEMPSSLARRLALTFATKIVKPRPLALIKRMAHRFSSVTFYDGYTHAQLPDILSGIDLAVVPVLWEDNLPQVAIECVASGIPILTSNRGGAQELLGCRDLVFRAGSRADFHAKIQGILDNPAILAKALAGRARLSTPQEHYDRLREKVYGGTEADPSSLAPAEAAMRLSTAGLFLG
ncbi:MAG TPA: glycosyltransferase [Gemmataceae bacterium]|nr:glycosyltransferase [Gemmataceae bacterium]